MSVFIVARFRVRFRGNTGVRVCACARFVVFSSPSLVPAIVSASPVFSSVFAFVAGSVSVSVRNSLSRPFFDLPFRGLGPYLLKPLYPSLVFYSAAQWQVYGAESHLPSWLQSAIMEGVSPPTSSTEEGSKSALGSRKNEGDPGPKTVRLTIGRLYPRRPSPQAQLLYTHLPYHNDSIIINTDARRNKGCRKEGTWRNEAGRLL